MADNIGGELACSTHARREPLSSRAAVRRAHEAPTTLKSRPSRETALAQGVFSLSLADRPDGGDGAQNNRAPPAPTFGDAARKSANQAPSVQVGRPSLKAPLEWLPFSL